MEPRAEGRKIPGLPPRLNPPLETGQWWHFDRELVAVLVVVPGDVVSLRPLKKETWPGGPETDHTYVWPTVGECLWSMWVVPRKPPEDVFGMSLRIGQVRILADGRVFFVTPGLDDHVALRAAFKIDEMELQPLYVSDVLYDSYVDDYELVGPRSTMYERVVADEDDL